LVEKQQTAVSARRASKSRELGTILGLAFVGWALCAAIMGIGMSVTSLSNTLVIHAIGAPIIFAILSVLYLRRFNYTTPLVTAASFTAFVMAMDFFVVALLIQRSLAMFASILGTWLPFALIFLSTYLTGLYATRKKID
jgi:hypothetical protein